MTLAENICTSRIVIGLIIPLVFRFTMNSFGKLSDGHAVQLHTLRNANGVRIDICNYGGTIVRIFAPDRHGNFADVVLGFDRIEDYVAHSPYFGSLIGRFGNRIANGKFCLNGETFQLAKNNAPNGIPCHLHGGRKGFDRVIWQAESFTSDDGDALQLRYRSPDMEEGYPGNLDVTVLYTLTA